MNKLSFSDHGKETSISLEPEFQADLHAIAQAHKISVNALIRHIKSEKPCKNLTRAVRLWLYAYAKEQSCLSLPSPELSGTTARTSSSNSQSPVTSPSSPSPKGDFPKP